MKPAWLNAFEAVLRRCALQLQDTVEALSESQSRLILPQLARLAAARLGPGCSASNCPVSSAATSP